MARSVSIVPLRLCRSRVVAAVICAALAFPPPSLPKALAEEPAAPPATAGPPPASENGAPPQSQPDAKRAIPRDAGDFALPRDPADPKDDVMPWGLPAPGGCPYQEEPLGPIV